MENIQLYLGIFIGSIVGIVIGWALLQKTIKAPFESRELDLRSDLSAAAEKAKKLEQQFNEGKSTLKKLQDDLSLVQNKKAEMEKNLNETSRKLKEFEAAAGHSTKHFNDLQTENNKNKARNSELEKEISELSLEANKLRTQASELKKDSEKSHKELEQTKKDLSLTSSKKLNAEEKVEIMEKKLETLTRESIELENIKNKYSENVKTLESLKEAHSKAEKQSAVYEEKSKQLESQLLEKKTLLEKVLEESDDLKKELSVECARRSTAEEKLALIPRLEHEISSLKTEIAASGSTRELLQNYEKQFEEIKSLQGRMVSENMALKQKSFASNILEIKEALEKAVEAYNKTVGLIDNRLLVQGEKHLEIEIATNREKNENSIEASMER
ncbi:MAG: hypothetical protein HQM10_19660 [Candidatus Riflebacteria bacterium]|nr:hypothetical protein [Candidatus Riflebacteria bacterium]